MTAQQWKIIGKNGKFYNKYMVYIFLYNNVGLILRGRLNRKKSHVRKQLFFYSKCYTSWRITSIEGMVRMDKQVYAMLFIIKKKLKLKILKKNGHWMLACGFDEIDSSKLCALQLGL